MWEVRLSFHSCSLVAERMEEIWTGVYRLREERVEASGAGRVMLACWSQMLWKKARKVDSKVEAGKWCLM